jgi:predicted nucleotidyltransferase
MDTVISRNIDKIGKICQEHKVERLFVFGSIASGNVTTNSDIDLLISFSDDITIDEYTENYFKLHHLFEEIFHRPVDLITENSLSNPFFIHTLEKTKILIYESKDEKISV